MDKQKLKDILCCGENPTIEETTQEDRETSLPVDGFGVLCAKGCHGIFNVDRETAITHFLDHKNTVDKRNDEKQTTPRIGVSKKESKKPVSNNNQLAVISPISLIKYFGDHRNELVKIASPVLSGDTSSMERFYINNTERYPLSLKGKAWDRVWLKEKENGSIVRNIENSFIDCVELGVTGDLVPMGDVCVLIPSVESYEFRLTHGKNAPFESIDIVCVYEGDEATTGNKNGNFFYDIIDGEEKYKVKSVIVSGEFKKTGRVIGEKFSAKRLLEKAEEHSAPYANYMKKIKAYEYQKSEGNVTVDKNGRESFIYFETAKDDDKYFDQSVSFFKQAEANNQLKKEGNREYAEKVISPTFTKKIYRDYIEAGEVRTTIWLDELSNPYAGADQPEMMRKTAGKSWTRKFAKVRNTESAMGEVRNSKDAMRESSNLAKGQFEDDVIDQEVI